MSSLRQARDSRKYFYFNYSWSVQKLYSFENSVVDPLSVYVSTSNRTFILVE